VLTPEGHVRVIAVPSDATHVPPPAAQSIKKSSISGSKKEKH
jgi:hypothetical protein